LFLALAASRAAGGYIGGMLASLKCRSFRFSLRTLFIAITIFGVYLGWQMHVVRQRQAILAALARPGAPNTYFVTVEEMEADKSQPATDGQYDHLRICWSRRLLGDQALVQISVNHDVDRRLLEQAEHAFPEADLIVFAGGEDGPLIESSRDSLYCPVDRREPNIGSYFKTGLKKQ
jgi:hypothetical protein